MTGITLSGGIAYWYLIQDYRQYSAGLLESIDDLNLALAEVKSQGTAIAKIERDVLSLKQRDLVDTQQLASFRTELIQLQEKGAVDLLELKTQVYKCGQDIAAIQKRIS